MPFARAAARAIRNASRIKAEKSAFTKPIAAVEAISRFEGPKKYQIQAKGYKKSN